MRGSCAAAILEMMLHTRRGVNHLFAGAPASWNIARRMPKADAEAMAENSRQQASARSVAVEFGVHVSDQAPR